MSSKPIAELTRRFLYECPGGMSDNEDRDKFLRLSLNLEDNKADFHLILEHSLRAAFFQGKAEGKFLVSRPSSAQLDPKKYGIVFATLCKKEEELRAQGIAIQQQLAELQEYMERLVTDPKPCTKAEAERLKARDAVGEPETKDERDAQCTPCAECGGIRDHSEDCAAPVKKKRKKRLIEKKKGSL